MSNQNNIIVNENINLIQNFLKYKSEYLCNLVEKNVNSSFTLITKHLSYADMLSAGKRKKRTDSFSKDYLLYLTTKELKKLNLGTTKQSNITMPAIFYKKLGIEQLQRRKGKQIKKHDHICLNNYANVFLVNDSLKYFNYEYTFKVFNELEKQVKWKEENHKLNLSSSDLTEIQITHAIHGIGVKEDTQFHMLRHFLFRNDILHCLIENTEEETNVYFCFERNPKFFTIIGESNTAWEKYVTEQNTRYEQKLKLDNNSLIEEDEKTRKLQSKWRNMLADEAMNYSSHDGEVFCAFTMISADYENLGTIFRASHIKRYENCNPNEAFDLNNGLLLCANADALFDKFLITVDENKELIFSFLLEKNYDLRTKLLLNQPIFTMLLNDERMKYMSWHREQFFAKEIERKTN